MVAAVPTLRLFSLLPLSLAGVLAAVLTVHPARADEAAGYEAVQHGTACWHGGASRTTSGERWASGGFMAAHRSLPFGTRVRVVNLQNGRSTVVRITDRGPYTRNRVIDITPAAAREIGLLEAGIGQVRVEVIPDQVGELPGVARPSV